MQSQAAYLYKISLHVHIYTYRSALNDCLLQYVVKRYDRQGGEVLWWSGAGIKAYEVKNL